MTDEATITETPTPTCQLGGFRGATLCISTNGRPTCREVGRCASVAGTTLATTSPPNGGAQEVVDENAQALSREPKPALSPDEWEAWMASDETDRECARLEYCVGLRGDGMAVDGRYRREERHALAALCLYQQPFGFTHEDVALLDRLNRDNDWQPGDARGVIDTSITPEDTLRLRSLASRIASLLPPTGAKPA